MSEKYLDRAIFAVTLAGIVYTMVALTVATFS